EIGVVGPGMDRREPLITRPGAPAAAAMLESVALPARREPRLAHWLLAPLPSERADDGRRDPARGPAAHWARLRARVFCARRGRADPGRQVDATGVAPVPRAAAIPWSARDRSSPSGGTPPQPLRQSGALRAPRQSRRRVGPPRARRDRGGARG